MKQVRIINKTKNNIVLERGLLADSFLSRLKGLMGRKTLEDDEGLIIKPCNSIHSFGMKFNIDVAFVDKDNKICHIIPNMERRTFSPIIKDSKFVIEGKAGRFEDVGLEVGDEVLLEDN